MTRSDLPPLNEREPPAGEIAFRADCPLCGGVCFEGWDEDAGGNIRSDGTWSCQNPACDYFYKAAWLLEAETRWEREAQGRDLPP